MLKQRQDSIAKFCAGISVHFRMRQSECQIIGHSALEAQWQTLLSY